MSQAFGIYVHWPFCAAKCPYCDFNSHVRERFDDMRWAAAIARELESVAALQGEHRPAVSSIFFGGGTPSLMGGAATGAVLDAIAKHWSVAEGAEITLEANPNSVEQERFRDYRAAGVNRVSIGVQALNDDALKFLGRLHGADEAKAAIKLAAAIFPRVSFDLIYARPDQTLAEWRSELEEALRYGTEHLSLYQLTIEKGTSFETQYRLGKFALPEDALAADLFALTDDMCSAHGLHAYEVSNHARPGAESRHNLLYWRYQPYAGVGPGAHGRLAHGAGMRATLAERLPERWFAKVEGEGSSLETEEIGAEDAAQENLLMAMRLSEGLDLEGYETRWNTRLSREKISDLAGEGLVVLEKNRLSATPTGRLVLNTLIAELAR
jgi:putative oxygen-independent coproporphyrinogen III oxidase